MGFCFLLTLGNPIAHMKIQNDDFFFLHFNDDPQFLIPISTQMCVMFQATPHPTSKGTTAPCPGAGPSRPAAARTGRTRRAPSVRSSATATTSSKGDAGRANPSRWRAASWPPRRSQGQGRRVSPPESRSERSRWSARTGASTGKRLRWSRGAAETGSRETSHGGDESWGFVTLYKSRIFRQLSGHRKRKFLHLNAIVLHKISRSYIKSTRLRSVYCDWLKVLQQPQFANHQV